MTADWTQGATSADDAVACVRSGMRVFIHGAAATPTPLIEALARRTDLDNITLYHLHTSGPAPFATPEQQGRFFSVSLFTGPPLRAASDDGRADFMPASKFGFQDPTTGATLPVGHPLALWDRQ